jgi:hypothetical protein
MADIDVLVISELMANSDKPPWLISLARTLGWGLHVSVPPPAAETKQ